MKYIVIGILLCVVAGYIWSGLFLDYDIQPTLINGLMLILSSVIGAAFVTMGVFSLSINYSDILED